MEPIKYDKNFTIANETDEFGQVTFIQKGSVKIGFEFQKMKKFVLKKENHCVVGAYGLTFNQRSRFIYRISSKQAKGYFIRRAAWHSILKKKPDIAVILIHNIIQDYVLNIRTKVYYARNQIIKRYEQRNDHDMILVNTDKSTHAINLLNRKGIRWSNYECVKEDIASQWDGIKALDSYKDALKRDFEDFKFKMEIGKCRIESLLEMIDIKDREIIRLSDQVRYLEVLLEREQNENASIKNPEFLS